LITADVYAMLLDSSKYGGETNTNKWTDLGMSELGVKVYGSTWWWTIS
jgi:hypothetical protein